MKLLYNWLKEFADVPDSAAGLRSRLSLAGVSIDSIEESGAGPVLDAEITINRPDLLGHLGVAREAAALYGVNLTIRKPILNESSEPASQAAQVEVESADLCARYTARVIRGVKVRPSPDWLRQRLEALGQSSINNVVDATNYVMLELGQPLHAFDFDKLAGHRIVVRPAAAGETMRTLDGIERKLSKNICLICDARAPVAIAGVMGGEESEIGFGTKNLLLESAWFDPISIRRASKALGLRTEASMRFERGADIEMAASASERAAELIQQLAGGQILARVIDVYPRPRTPLKVELSRKELLRVMGADVPDQEIENILSALAFAPSRTGVNRESLNSLAAVWTCTIPSWRSDITREIDLIEEVARLYGYDKFPARLPPAKQPSKDLPFATEAQRVREMLIALGYQEIIAIPLVSAERDALFRPENVIPAEIANPLSEDASIMRTSGTVSMTGAIEWNVNHGEKNLRLFEMGRVYELRDGKPVETQILTLGATGLVRLQSIHEPAREFSFADLKGDLDEILSLAGSAHWRLGGPKWLASGRAGTILLASDKNEIGFAGRLSRSVAQKFKFRQDVYLAELKLEPSLQAIAEARANLRYEPLPRFPAVDRDFSIVLKDGTPFASIQQIIRDLSIPELRRIEAVDLFRGGQIHTGKHSLLLRVTFQSATSTLTEEQLADFHARISSALSKKLGASLRTT